MKLGSFSDTDARTSTGVIGCLRRMLGDRMAVNMKSSGWHHTPEGWVYEVRAVSPSGRIIARAKASLSYDDAHDIIYYLGADVVGEIERSTHEACDRLVPAAEK